MKKILITAVAGALLAAAPAMAADDGGFYVGAGVGSFGVDVGAFGGDDIGYKAFAGWMFNPYIGAEVEYLDGGTAEDRGAEIDMTGFNASLRGAFPIGDQFSVFAKVGMIFWDADVSIFEGTGNDSGEDVSWGVGAGLDFTDNFGMTIEYQGFEIEDTDTVDLISASVVWKF
jgi:opacity protein-like surface antigen